MRFARFVFGFLFFSLTLGCNFSREEVDLIVHNAVIWTADGENPTAEAFAVKDGRIIEISAERRILNRYRAETMYDARKQFIYPGFIDAHAHFLGYGLNKAQADLTGCTSIAELLDRLVKHRENYPGEWLLGRGWDQNRFDSQAYPTRYDLDELFPDVPVYLVRVDGHAALVNSEALRRAGVEKVTDIKGGQIHSLDGQTPSGVLIDNAMDLVKEVIPPASRDERIRALREAETTCFKYGLTGIGDAGLSKVEIELIQELHESGELLMPIYAMIKANEEEINYYIERGPFTNERLNVRSFKVYADGALGSRGACLIEPYTDRMESGHRGFLLTELDAIEDLAMLCYEAGFQVNTHCIGDSANRAVLDIYGKVLGEPNDRRWRIEHAQVVHKEDVPMFGAYTIIPSVQPTHATSDMPWAEIRLGRNRIRRAYAYADLLKENGLLALGTDFPVEEVNPLNTFYAAVFRRDAQGQPENGFQTENALPREQALYGMTLWAALAQFEEEEKGSLTPGKYADFVVLSRDLLTAGMEQVLQTSVSATYLRGELVYDKDLSRKAPKP